MAAGAAYDTRTKRFTERLRRVCELGMRPRSRIGLFLLPEVQMRHTHHT